MLKQEIEKNEELKNQMEEFKSKFNVRLENGDGDGYSKVKEILRGIFN